MAWLKRIKRWAWEEAENQIKRLLEKIITRRQNETDLSGEDELVNKIVYLIPKDSVRQEKVDESKLFEKICQFLESNFLELKNKIQEMIERYNVKIADNAKTVYFNYASTY